MYKINFNSLSNNSQVNPLILFHEQLIIFQLGKLILALPHLSKKAINFQLKSLISRLPFTSSSSSSNSFFSHSTYCYWVFVVVYISSARRENWKFCMPFHSLSRARYNRGWLKTKNSIERTIFLGDDRV